MSPFALLRKKKLLTRHDSIPNLPSHVWGTLLGGRSCRKAPLSWHVPSPTEAGALYFGTRVHRGDRVCRAGEGDFFPTIDGSPAHLLRLPLVGASSPHYHILIDSSF